MSFMVKSKTKDSVKCEVVDGGELKSRRHLNVRGKSATLPSITGSTFRSSRFFTFSSCLGRIIEYLKGNRYLLQCFSSRREGLGGY